jgi:Methylase involved in ubiquinone/menaquinone biosynthesis
VNFMNMNMKTESEKQEALVKFNKMADFYDKYRPDYPQELVDTIIDKANLTAGSKLLEIGAGSGKATAQFVDFGFEIVCIEPGNDLAERGNAKLKNKNVEFIVSSFEDYSEPFEYFDAIISAQAFHWVSQPLGYEKCANTLKTDGYLAPFWHLDLFADSEFDRELWAVINKYNGFVSCMQEKDYRTRVESITSKITASGLFLSPEVIHFYQENNFTADEYYNYMLTGGVDGDKQACLEELTQLAEKYNGIKRRFTYELYLAKKL